MEILNMLSSGADAVGTAAGNMVGNVAAQLLTEKGKGFEEQKTEIEEPEYTDTEPVESSFEYDDSDDSFNAPGMENILDSIDYDDIDTFVDDIRQEQPNVEYSNNNTVPESNVEIPTSSGSYNDTAPIDLGEQKTLDIEHTQTYDYGPQSEDEYGYVKDYNTVELNNNYDDISAEDIEINDNVELPENTDISEEDIYALTGERPTEEQLEIINEIADKRNDDIELNENATADILNSLEDNGSDIKEEEVQSEIADTDGDSKIIKEAISNSKSKDVEDIFDNAFKSLEQKELEEQYRRNYTDDNGVPLDLNKNIFGNTAWVKKEDLISNLPQGYTIDDVEIKVGKDKVGFYFYAVPSLEDNGSDIKEAISNSKSKNTEEMFDNVNYFFEQKELEEQCRRNYTDDNGVPLDLNKNIFGNKVYVKKEDLISNLPQGYTIDDVEIKVGKDEEGFYFYAVPSFKREQFDAAQKKAQTTMAADMSEKELKNVLKNKRDERKAKEDAEKLKNLPTYKIENALRTWKRPTQEEWEASYKNGTRGQLSRGEAKHRRYVKELAIRKFLAKNPAYKQFEKEIRKEIGSKSKVTEIKERLGQRYEPTDYDGRMLAVVYRELSKQPPLPNKEVEEVENVFVKDNEGNLTEPTTSLTEVSPNEVDKVPENYDQTTDTLMINDETGEVVVATTNTLGENELPSEYEPVEGSLGDEETYLEESILPEWTKFNDGSWSRELKQNEWEELGLTEEEYEDGLISEAETQAKMLGMSPGSYEVEITENKVSLVPLKEKDRKRLHFTFWGNVELPETADVELSEDITGHNDSSNFTLDDSQQSVVSNGLVGGSSAGSSDISTSSSRGTKGIEVPTVDNELSKLSGKSISVDNSLKGNGSSYKLPSSRTAAQTASKLLKEKKQNGGFNREQSKDTSLKSKYRRVGSNSKQLSLSTIHNDNSMITLIDKLSSAVIKHYHNWSKSGQYFYFNGEEGKIRYKIGGSIEVRFKGEPSWVSLKTLSKKTGVSDRLQKLIDEVNRG